MTALKASFKLLAFVIWCLICVPVQILVLCLTRGPSSLVIPRLWHRGVCFIFGIKLEIIGQIPKNKQVIYLSNHLSHLDIPVLGAHLPGSFVAKSDVAGWPVLGQLALLQRTVFISRTSRDVKTESVKLDKALSEKRSLILFPEGTSTDGTELRPFKTSLFALFTACEMRGFDLHPLSLQLISADGKRPQTQEIRDIYTWHGDMEFAPHLWNFAKTTGAKLRLTIHPAMTLPEDLNRKTLAQTAHEQVRSGLDHLV